MIDKAKGCLAYDKMFTNSYLKIIATKSLEEDGISSIYKTMYGKLRSIPR
jgi:hypothetical protein